MQYFSLIYSKFENIRDCFESGCNLISNSNYKVSWEHNNKFIDDKIYIDNELYTIILEGVILNKFEFSNKYPNLKWDEIVWLLYNENGNTFFNAFRGSFAGIVYDKKENIWTIFNDHIGSKPLYYYLDDSYIAISNLISNIYNFFKKYDINYNLNIDGAYMLLSFGYMINGNTLCDKINKIPPGHFITIKDNKISKQEYYNLPLSTIYNDSLKENDVIENIDCNFRKAVKLQFDKDKEYNYKHFVGLSGGLDSRMTSWVAHEMGYTDQLNFTFSQSNYLDETIAKSIASYLKHEWIFKSLDNGLFLKSLDEITKISGGNVLYYGLAHGNSLYKLINFNDLGIIHTGQLGDIVIGSFIDRINENNFSKYTGAYSNKYISKLTTPLQLSNNLTLLENELIYRRGFDGANSSFVLTNQYSETMSPFYDIDFFEHCLSIPLNLRVEHNIYKKWIIKKYPKAAQYIWEKAKSKITQKQLFINYKGSKLSLAQAYFALMKKTGLSKKHSNGLYSMNPLEYWYNTNSNLKKFQDNYFEINIVLLEKYDNLKKDIIDLYYKGSAIEKNQILTLLSALNCFFK